jgi:hypothetical protein
MRSLVVFLLAGSLAGDAFAECSYFRVGYRLLQCQPELPRGPAATSEPAAQDPPELQEPVSATPVHVTCSCDYSLRGSDLRCDLDQTKEVAQLIGSEEPLRLCRRGKNLCSSLCPKRLP